MVLTRLLEVREEYLGENLPVGTQDLFYNKSVALEI